jgi:hypothetical protein
MYIFNLSSRGFRCFHNTTDEQSKSSRELIASLSFAPCGFSPKIHFLGISILENLPQTFIEFNLFKGDNQQLIFYF